MKGHREFLRARAGASRKVRAQAMPETARQAGSGGEQTPLALWANRGLWAGRSGSCTCGAPASLYHDKEVRHATTIHVVVDVPADVSLGALVSRQLWTPVCMSPRTGDSGQNNRSQRAAARASHRTYKLG